ncbi:MAG: HprK-related kinase A [Rhodocyclaceae bacterium]|nr:HprK-related kinase A [Rhodocyclaceae bacterium]
MTPARIAGILPRDFLEDGVILLAPPFVFRIRSPLPFVWDAIASSYADFSILDDYAFVDFELTIAPVNGLRRWVSPLVNMSIDGVFPFDALPASQAYPLLEWGMNWCVTSTAHHFLMCHSAVLAWNDLAVILPAPPGSGKSTLCAALTMSGWRLLSDELALLDPESLMLSPFVRPVSLKNASIELIGQRFPAADFTLPVKDTIKGEVAHMRPTTESVLQSRTLAKPRWLIFPQYDKDVELELKPMQKAEAVVELAKNAFNFRGFGAKGFSTLGALVDSVDCYRLTYSSLDLALAKFKELGEEVCKTNV